MGAPPALVWADNPWKSCDARLSPLGVALKTSGARLFKAGSVMESELQNPGDYKQGKEKVSMLIVGYYCLKKQSHEEGAGFQVSSSSIMLVQINSQ